MAVLIVTNASSWSSSCRLVTPRAARRGFPARRTATLVRHDPARDRQHGSHEVAPDVALVRFDRIAVGIARVHRNRNGWRPQPLAREAAVDRSPGSRLRIADGDDQPDIEAACTRRARRSNQPGKCAEVRHDQCHVARVVGQGLIVEIALRNSIQLFSTHGISKRSWSLCHRSDVARLRRDAVRRVQQVPDGGTRSPAGGCSTSRSSQAARCTAGRGGSLRRTSGSRPEPRRRGCAAPCRSRAPG